MGNTAIVKMSELQYVETINPSVEAFINWMVAQAQSFVLSYGEDNGAWECLWIVGGQRYTSTSKNLINALWEALAEANLFPLGDGAGRIAIYRKAPDEPNA